MALPAYTGGRRQGPEKQGDNFALTAASVIAAQRGELHAGQGGGIHGLNSSCLTRCVA